MKLIPIILLLAAVSAPAALRAQVAAPPASPAPDSRVYEMSEVEEQPELINRREAARSIGREYPPRLRDAGQGGSVTITFVVDEEGRPVRLAVQEATAHEFGAAALNVVARMRFKPGRVGGRPVPVRVTVPIRFEVVFGSLGPREAGPPPPSATRAAAARR